MKLFHLASHLHFTVPMATAFHPHIHSGPNPRSARPTVNQHSILGPTIPPYGHLISCHPFPLTKCWVCKLCNKLFLSENKGTRQPDPNEAVTLSYLSVVQYVPQHTYISTIAHL